MRPLAMSEKEWAVALANKVLDTPSRDPDDDLSTMSRQFLRGQESIASLQSEITRLRTTIEGQSVTLQDSSAALAVVTKERDAARDALRNASDVLKRIGRDPWTTDIVGILAMAMRAENEARAALNASAGEAE